MAKYKQKMNGYTEDEMNVKLVYVKCEWTERKNDNIWLIKYFSPCDLVKEKTALQK